MDVVQTAVAQPTTSEATHDELLELSALQLAVIGGGIGETSL